MERVKVKAKRLSLDKEVRDFRDYAFEQLDTAFDYTLEFIPEQLMNDCIELNNVYDIVRRELFDNAHNLHTSVLFIYGGVHMILNMTEIIIFKLDEYDESTLRNRVSYNILTKIRGSCENIITRFIGSVVSVKMKLNNITQTSIADSPAPVDTYKTVESIKTMINKLMRSSRHRLLAFGRFDEFREAIDKIHADICINNSTEFLVNSVRYEKVFKNMNECLTKYITSTPFKEDTLEPITAFKDDVLRVINLFSFITPAVIEHESDKADDYSLRYILNLFEQVKTTITNLIKHVDEKCSENTYLSNHHRIKAYRIHLTKIDSELSTFDYYQLISNFKMIKPLINDIYEQIPIYVGLNDRDPDIIQLLDKIGSSMGRILEVMKVVKL